MVTLFEGGTANEAWQQSFNRFQSEIGTHPQPSRGGMTREILHCCYSIADPRQRWVVARQPAINLPFAIAEIIWIMSGRNDSAFLAYWNSQLTKYAGAGPTYHGAYGYRLRHEFGIDQLERAYYALRHNPDSRQVVLQIWNPNLDLPNVDGGAASPDIPCNIQSILKIRDQKLEWVQILRSNDLFRGVPYNFVQFTTIQEIMAGWLGVELGSYCHFSDSLHFYTADAVEMKAQSDCVVEANTDFLCADFQATKTIFAELAYRVDQMPKMSKNSLEDSAFSKDLVGWAQNMLLIMAAETARHKEWGDLSEELQSKCKNPVFTQLFSRWRSRFERVAGKKLNLQ